MERAVRDVLEPAPQNLRMFRVRLVLAAIELAPEDSDAQAQLLSAIVGDTVHAGDAYAAREILRHRDLAAAEKSRRRLQVIVRDGHLGQGSLPESALSTMTQAISTAEASLVRCLAEGRGGTAPKDNE
ncbi:hypothetical protein [Streptomyces sp. NPDC021020]|uniref:hypothetical protein n=1 Tax=Streptomyces sp. NPDC021020 TaxID=3365109 RepID=UPI0037A1C070